MSFRYELGRKGFSREKAHYLVTLQNDRCCFIGLTFRLSLKLSFFFNNIILCKHERPQYVPHIPVYARSGYLKSLYTICGANRKRRPKLTG